MPNRFDALIEAGSSREEEDLSLNVGTPDTVAIGLSESPAENVVLQDDDFGEWIELSYYLYVNYHNWKSLEILPY